MNKAAVLPGTRHAKQIRRHGSAAWAGLVWVHIRVIGCAAVPLTGWVRALLGACALAMHRVRPGAPAQPCPPAVSILLPTALCSFTGPEPCVLVPAPLPATCREDQEAEAVCGEPEIPPQEDDLSAGSGDGYSGDTLEASPSPAPLRLRANMRRRRAA